MAIVDKNGNVRGVIGPSVSRKYRDLNVLQSKPGPYEQKSIASKLCSIETGIASTSSKILRAWLDPINSGFDKSFHSRLTGAIRTSLDRSKTAELGKRDLYEADLSRLKSVQMNTFSPLNKFLLSQPVAQMLPEGKLSIKLPAIKDFKDLKNPGNHARTFLRFLSIALHFKAEKARYLECKDFVLERSDKLEEQEYLMDCRVPEGCVIVLGFSIYWQLHSLITGSQILNTKEMGPAEIFGAWQSTLAAGHGSNISDFSNDHIEKEGYQWKPLDGYEGNRLLKDAAALHLKYIPKKPSKSKGDGAELFPFVY